MSQEPSYDPDKATALIGRTLLVGITYETHDGLFVERRQMFGTIAACHPEDGISVTVEGQDPYVLPPATNAVFAAKPGEYYLRDADRFVENPDYIATFTIRKPPPTQ